ncbi:hypothetical protein D3C87_1194480 [compost metagenome]
MLLRNDPGAGRQRLIQPVQADLFDFNPAIAHGLETALLEGLAMAVAVEQGEAAMQWAWREQRDQMAHGEVPCGRLLRRLPVGHYVQVYGG